MSLTFASPEQGEMRLVTYPVQLLVDKGMLSTTISTLHHWFDEQKIEVHSLQYRVCNQGVQIGVNFTNLIEAGHFASVFDGLLIDTRKDLTRGYNRGPSLKVSDLIECRVDWDSCAFVVAGKVHRVQRQVWLLFATLARHAGRLVTRRQICETLYGDDPSGGPLATDRIINVRMYQLRRACPWPVRTVHGIGFVLEGFKSKRPTPAVNAAVGLKRGQLMAGR